MGNKQAIRDLPGHLKDFVVVQNPTLYTPMDHAVWRFVLAVSKRFFKEYGHPLYLEGLRTTGISTDRIPLVQEIDDALQKFGWRAVAINGFIPPAVFLEFQSLRILAIACDIRKFDSLGYTASPDIIHEAAGHVPIVADPGYRNYLEAYGEVSRRAILSVEDLNLYEAILELSDLKESSSADEASIAEAQINFEAASAAVTYDSEASLITRMAWWTTEYGLIGSLKDPKIFGAGLLSSVVESFHAISPEIKKVPFTLACIQQSYDITRPQPQLYVAKNFQELIDALDAFSKTMAYRIGGEVGLSRAVQAATVNTVEFEDGLQVSGVLESFRTGINETEYTWSGPCQKARRDQEVEGASVRDFPKGLRLTRREKVVSVFGGAADREAYLTGIGGYQQSKPSSHKSNLTPQNAALNACYGYVRRVRDAKDWNPKILKGLQGIHAKLETEAPQDWLLRFEIKQLFHRNGSESHPLCRKIDAELEKIATSSQSLRELIERGIRECTEDSIPV